MTSNAAGMDLFAYWDSDPILFGENHLSRQALPSPFLKGTSSSKTSQRIGPTPRHFSRKLTQDDRFDYRGEICVIVINHGKNLLPSETVIALLRWSLRDSPEPFCRKYPSSMKHLEIAADSVIRAFERKIFLSPLFLVNCL
jgi:hypothetical protein